MVLSRKIEDMNYSPIRRLGKYVTIAKNKGVSVIHLNIGQPDLATPVEFLDKLKSIDDSVLKYTDSRGLDVTVESFIKYYKSIGIDFDCEDIVVTMGGSEALLFSFIAICDEGDEIIIPEPYYSNYNSFAETAGVNVVPVKTTIEEGYRLPKREVFESKITDKTRAIVISNPCNPTGVLYTKEELNMLLDLADEYGIYVISDEVYRDFVYDNEKPLSIYDLNRSYDKIIMVDSISKRYSSCGARIGVLASKKRNIIDNVLKLCQARLCVPYIEQVMASAVSEVSEDYILNAKTEYEKRRNALFNGLSSIEGVKCISPGGAFYIMVKLPVEDSEDFAKWILTNFNVDGETIMVAPGSGFYSTEGLGKNEVRISYCLDVDKINRFIHILKLGLEEYNRNHR